VRLALGEAPTAATGLNSNTGPGVDNRDAKP
jgi:hypothetical protein